MVVREKISGALYADAVLGEEESFDPEALGLLTYLAGLVVDRLAARKLKPAPALRVLEVVKRPEPAGMWMNEGAAAVEELPEAAEASEAIEVEPEVPHAAAPRAAEQPRPQLEEAPESAMTKAISIETPAIPMPELTRRLSGPLAVAVGDERHEEARRFARLLVSEIKLYNERAVLEGREAGNLYRRLKEDIDRSRQMYNERIPADVRTATDFFQEELVRILADGRAEALGIVDSRPTTFPLRMWLA